MCMYSVLERIKIEGVADIFQYIKGARFNRPGLVQNVVCDTLLFSFPFSLSLPPSLSLSLSLSHHYLFLSQVQYEFCHDLVLEYINSFDAYHNF